MNYLAHLFLAQPHPDSYFGNLLGDFRRGVNVEQYDVAVQAGLANHILVDKFTDAHQSVILARQLVSPVRRRFAGIMLDICFDHFLLRHWNTFSAESLASFSQRVYTGLAERHEHMPPPMQRMVGSMLNHKWLAGYDYILQLEAVLDRTASRIRFRHQFYGSIVEVKANYAAFEAAFLALFPALIAHVKRHSPEKRPEFRELM
ncbi:ACP phosphodiesterase [Alteromonas sp. AMM-1]|uniref:acyl carrier protein phosphodiesterase n=1 Tax=Alteromonas sp. AMM-1 TaxID=3394233 RepID=UPI0039A6A7B0